MAVPLLDISSTLCPVQRRSDDDDKLFYFVDHFTSYFDLLLATTDEQKDLVYRIRGDVYCKEFKYEPEENCPGGLEKDEYDAHSLHCLVMHRERQLPAGCVRLIFIPDRDNNFLLPMEKYCANSLTNEILHPAHLERTKILEASRLAVHPLFRKRLGEKSSPDGMNELAIFSSTEQRAFPLISNVLILAGLALADLTGRSHTFVMMEPRLARLLQHLGLEFVQVGALIEYHGLRAAFYLNTQNGIKNIKDHIIELYDFTYRTLAESYLMGGRSAV